MSEKNKESAQKEAQSEAGKRLETIRHSVSHVMAQAVVKLFPGTKVAIGPSIENGFYYDFLLPRPATTDDLSAIEAEMKTIINSRQDFTPVTVSRQEALRRFAEEEFKLELISELPESEDITIYENRNAEGKALWADLCRGPHVANTREINSAAFKLQSLAGAYWRGDEKRPMLTRIYGTAWENPKDLKSYLAFLEEVEKRDHRRVGKELELYSVHEEAGAGLVYWNPNGGRMRVAVEDFWRRSRSGADLLESQRRPYACRCRGFLAAAALPQRLRNTFLAAYRKKLALGNFRAFRFLQRCDVQPDGN